LETLLIYSSSDPQSAWTNYSQIVSGNRSYFIFLLIVTPLSHLLTLAGGSPLGDQRPPRILLLGDSLCYNLLVDSSLLLVSEDRVHLLSLAGTLALQSKRSDKTLDLGCLADLYSLLISEFTSNDIVAYIISLGKVEKFADVVSTLGTKTTGDRVVSESRDLRISHLGNNKIENGNVLSYNASTNGLALTITATALTVTLVSLLHEKTDTSVGENTLTHGESLLVVSSGDTEDVTCVLLSEGGSINLLRHALLVKVLEPGHILNFYDLLKAGGGGGKIDL